MNTQFALNNRHIEDAANFNKVDPDLCLLKSHHYIHTFPLLEQFPTDNLGVYTLFGTHCVGKTTLLKSWMRSLLQNGISANTIAFFQGKQSDDYHTLERCIQNHLVTQPEDQTLYIILDEINLIRDWIKALKTLASAGRLNHSVLMISGSDSTITKEVETHLSTLLNYNKSHDFHLYPLSFRETVLLKHGHPQKTDILFNEFNHYLLHGGYLPAINDFAAHDCILDKTLINYAEWVVKQAEIHGRRANFMREILTSIIKHYNKQTTWNLLAQELTIDHPKTIGDYLTLLESIDTVFIQSALIEETLSPAPKKARKLMFTDPFIFHAIQAWLSPDKNYYETQIKSIINHTESYSTLSKTTVITQFKRYYTTHYIKAEGEIDLAYIHNKRFWPISIAWAHQMRAKDLKQILKYPNGRILTKTERSGIIEHIKTEPLPIALWQLECP